MQENLSLYHIFYIVSRTGNISQAAKELYISQPAISRAIKKLEDNLDTILFKRSSRGVTLTPDGQLLYEKVKAAFELLSEGEDSILHNRSREIPRLRIGASTTLCKYVLMPRLKNFISANPQMRITISCQSTYQTLRLLEEDRIDIGLIGRPGKLSGYEFLPLLQIQDTFVAKAVCKYHASRPSASAWTYSGGFIYGSSDPVCPGRSWNRMRDQGICAKRAG